MKIQRFHNCSPWVKSEGEKPRAKPQTNILPSCVHKNHKKMSRPETWWGGCSRDWAQGTKVCCKCITGWAEKVHMSQKVLMCTLFSPILMAICKIFMPTVWYLWIVLKVDTRRVVMIRTTSLDPGIIKSTNQISLLKPNTSGMAWAVMVLASSRNR